MDNLRAKPIVGHITDSAGNVVRNSLVTIKLTTPNSNYVVDSVNTNDNGYFATKPLKNGTYLVYDSGILITSFNHTPDPNSIPCTDTISENITSETGLDDSLSFIQIESEDIDIVNGGSTYPIYDEDLASIPEYSAMGAYFGMSGESRITTTRFDVEYNHNGTNVRWSGMPAVRYGLDTRLVIPIDLKSLVVKMPKQIGITTEYSEGAAGQFTLTNIGDAAEGDIVKYTSDIGSESIYGVVIIPGVSSNTLSIWTSSRVINSTTIAATEDPGTAKVYSGIPIRPAGFDDEVPNKFTVTENTYAQGELTESYTYA